MESLKNKIFITAAVIALASSGLAWADQPAPTGVVVPTPTGGAAGGATINGTTVVGRYEPLPAGSSINVHVITPSGAQAGVTTQTVNGQTTHVGGSFSWHF